MTWFAHFLLLLLSLAILPFERLTSSQGGQEKFKKGASNEATYLLLLSYLRERCRVEVVEEMMFWHHP